MPPSRRDHYQFLYGTTSGPEKLKEFDFPFFNQGDVEITLRGSRQYRLHSGILKSLSRTFRALLADEFTAQLSDRAKKKGAIMNRLIAVPNTDPAMYQCDVDLILVPLELDSDGKPVDAHPIGLDLENGRSVDLIYVVSCPSSSTLRLIFRANNEMLQAYEAVLGAFYNRPIELGNIENTSLSDMLEMALKVTLVAEYLEVVCDIDPGNPFPIFDGSNVLNERLIFVSGPRHHQVIRSCTSGDGPSSAALHRQQPSGMARLFLSYPLLRHLPRGLDSWCWSVQHSGDAGSHEDHHEEAGPGHCREEGQDVDGRGEKDPNENSLVLSAVYAARAHGWLC